MTELEKAIAIISAASGADATAVADRLKSDEAPTAAATELFEAKFTAQRDQGDQRATKKTRTEVENALKAAGVPDAKFSDLPGAIEALKASAAEDAGKGLTPEQALAHPAVKQKLNELTTATDRKVQEAVAKVNNDLKAEREAIAREKVVSKVSDKAAAVITELNPVFSQNPERAATQRADLLSRIANGRFVEVGGELFPADADGEVLKDSLGNAVKLTDLVRKQTEALYDLPTSSQRESTGHRQGDVADKNEFKFEHFKGEKPKNEEEYLKLRNDQSLPLAARKEVQAEWEARGQ